MEEKKLRDPSWIENKTNQLYDNLVYGTYTLPAPIILHMAKCGKIWWDKRIGRYELLSHPFGYDAAGEEMHLLDDTYREEILSRDINTHEGLYWALGPKDKKWESLERFRWSFAPVVSVRDACIFLQKEHPQYNEHIPIGFIEGLRVFFSIPVYYYYYLIWRKDTNLL